jgi:hypothetical protein
MAWRAQSPNYPSPFHPLQAPPVNLFHMARAMTELPLPPTSWPYLPRRQYRWLKITLPRRDTATWHMGEWCHRGAFLRVILYAHFATTGLSFFRFLDPRFPSKLFKCSKSSAILQGGSCGSSASGSSPVLATGAATRRATDTNPPTGRSRHQHVPSCAPRRVAKIKKKGIISTATRTDDGHHKLTITTLQQPKHGICSSIFFFFRKQL